METEYLKSIMKMMGKVSPQNRGYLRASGLDKAYGAAQAQKQGMLAQLGMRKQGQLHDVSMGKQQLSENNRRFNLGYDLAEDQMDMSESSMKKANLLSALGLGVAGIQGYNVSKERQKITDQLKQQAEMWKKITSFYGD